MFALTEAMDRKENAMNKLIAVLNRTRHFFMELANVRTLDTRRLEHELRRKTR